MSRLLLSTFSYRVVHYPNHVDLSSNVRPGKLHLNTYNRHTSVLCLSFEVQRMRLLEEPSFTTETRAWKNKILALSWAASMTRENEGFENNEDDLKDTFWKVLYDVFKVEIGQQRTSKSLQLLNLLNY